MARYVLCMPNEPIGSTGPFGTMYLNELLPIGQIGSIGPIGAICPIVANWANWFHRPNWRDMYYVCQIGQLVPRYLLTRLVLCMPIGPIGSMGPIGAICLIELLPLGQLVSSAHLARYVVMMPIGPIGSTDLIGAKCTAYANWANWIHGPNWYDMSQ